MLPVWIAGDSARCQLLNSRRPLCAAGAVRMATALVARKIIFSRGVFICNLFLYAILHLHNFAVHPVKPQMPVQVKAAELIERSDAIISQDQLIMGHWALLAA